MGKWREPLDEKVKRLTTINEEGCWMLVDWAEHTNRGYGRIWADGRHQLAHRVAYQAFIGPIPEGMDVGHKCHDAAAAAGTCMVWADCIHRACANPEHLKAEPRDENLGASPLTEAAKNAAKTHCSRGHEFTEDNIYWRGGGRWRSCRICNSMTTAQRAEWDANSS